MNEQIRKRVVSMATASEKNYVKRITAIMRNVNMNEKQIGENIKLFWKGRAEEKCITK